MSAAQSDAHDKFRDECQRLFELQNRNLAADGDGGQQPTRRGGGGKSSSEETSSSDEDESMSSDEDEAAAGHDVDEMGRSLESMLIQKQQQQQKQQKETVHTADSAESSAIESELKKLGNKIFILI